MVIEVWSISIIECHVKVERVIVEPKINDGCDAQSSSGEDSLRKDAISNDNEGSSGQRVTEADDSGLGNYTIGSTDQSDDFGDDKDLDQEGYNEEASTSEGVVHARNEELDEPKGALESNSGTAGARTSDGGKARIIDNVKLPVGKKYLFGIPGMPKNKREWLALSPGDREFKAFALQWKTAQKVAGIEMAQMNIAKKLSKMSVCRPDDAESRINKAGAVFEFKDRDKFIEFCEELDANEDKKADVKDFSRRHGGIDGKNTVTKLLKKTMANELALQFSRKGKGSKLPLDKYCIYDIVLGMFIIMS
ncbi:hypothetical protein QAD02_013129 [Eretmocerus hayati]|uniref:Uncharacterized protein n=1 Tax=Eretmocerus hayati TaxID=131215 RepID=A0ACC2P1T7_9HYME|nr:hypothetical protein QAD02_013129 [Eretmocerus hayati]